MAKYIHVYIYISLLTNAFDCAMSADKLGDVLLWS